MPNCPFCKIEMSKFERQSSEGLQKFSDEIWQPSIPVDFSTFFLCPQCGFFAGESDYTWDHEQGTLTIPKGVKVVSHLTQRASDVLNWCAKCELYQYFDAENKCRVCGTARR